MSARGFEAGAGDPWGDEYTSPPADFLLGVGADDSTEPLLDNGAGEPWLLGVDVDISIVVTDTPVSAASELYSPSRYEDNSDYSQEGGWVLELTALNMVFPDGVYRIDLVSTLDSQLYPTLKPGCNSARFGQRSDCRPLKNGTVLRFASAAAPTGEYEINVTFPDGMEVTVDGVINLTFVPDSPQVKSVMRLPYRVYSPRDPIQGF